MSLLGIALAQGQHRGLPPRKLRSLLQDAELRAELAEITCGGLEQQLDAAGIEISGLRYELEQEQTARKIAVQEGIRLQAALENATSVSVACGVRDIWPGEEPTYPQGLNVRTLRDQFAGASPSHVPGGSS